MSKIFVNQQVKQSAIRAVVTRADGAVEDLGLISFYSRNPLLRWGYKIGRRLGVWRA
jgi:hypothetical protein